MKKEELNYYDEFVKNIEFAEKSIKLINDNIDNFDCNNILEIQKEVHELENEADNCLHEDIRYLISDFLPPIDREDILTLFGKIDDLVDEIDEFVINLEMLDIKELRNDVKSYTSLIYKNVINIKEILVSLKHKKKYDEALKKVVTSNLYEEEGDKLYQKSIKELYCNEQDPIQIIKWTTIYNCLEECSDICEGIANFAEEIITKNN